MKNKVVLIGCGNVGMSYAYALLNQRTYVNELVLIDKDTKRVEGEVMDLNHCLAFAPSKIDIKTGDYNDCCDASIVVICAGANQKPGETRMDLIKKNSELFTLKVSGESMINVGIYDGDILIVERKNTATNGETVVAMNNDNEVTVKTFYKENGYFRLQPENDTMEPIILKECTILGKVVGLYRKL